MTSDEVKLLRKLLGLKQRELAAELGVSVNTIQNYEAGGVIPLAKQNLLNGMLNNAKSKIIDSSNSIHNTGSISGSAIIGYNNNNNDNSNNTKMDKDQTILLLEKEIEHLRELLAEKERFIQNLINK